MPSSESVDRPVGLLHSRLATADTNSTLVAAAVTQGANTTPRPRLITEMQVFNNTAAPKFLKFYDKATAPTVGTDVPVLRYTIPSNGSIIISSFAGIGPFLLGIGYGITGAIADNDTTALVANDVTVNLRYV